MSYYKITYESNTIEGLKAIQNNIAGQRTGVTDSNTFETREPPPPPQQGEGSADAFSGIVQPPPSPNEADATPGFSGETAFYPPPPIASDSAIMGIGLEEEIPPPPKS